CLTRLSPKTADSSPTFSFHADLTPRALHSFPTRRSSDLSSGRGIELTDSALQCRIDVRQRLTVGVVGVQAETQHLRSSAGERLRSEEHTSELQSRFDLVCRLLLEKKKNKIIRVTKRLSDT